MEAAAAEEDEATPAAMGMDDEPAADETALAFPPWFKAVAAPPLPPPPPAAVPAAAGSGRGRRGGAAALAFSASFAPRDGSRDAADLPPPDAAPDLARRMWVLPLVAREMRTAKGEREREDRYVVWVGGRPPGWAAQVKRPSFILS